MPEDEELNELDEQVSDELEDASEQSDEGEGDTATADAETSDAGADESDSETGPEAENPEPAPAPVTRPLNIPIPVAPVLGRTGEALWGPGEQQPGKPKPKNELSDLFAVPQPGDNDMYIDDLFDVPDEDVDLEDDLSDLTQVTKEDVMGRPPKVRPRKIRYSRTDRPYNPPTSMGETR